MPQVLSEDLEELTEPCGRIAAATLDDLVRARCYALWNPPRWNSASRDRECGARAASAFTTSGVNDWNVHGKKSHERSGSIS